MVDGKIGKTILPWAWLLLATLNSAVLVLWEKEALWVDSKQAAIGHADKLENGQFNCNLFEIIFTAEFSVMLRMN